MGCRGLTRFIFIVLMLVVSQTVAQNSTAEPQTSAAPGKVTTPPKVPSTTERPVPSTAEPTPEELCAMHNTSCSDCLGVSGATCLWCKSNSRCVPYPLKKVLPPSDLCALDKARWLVCWLNFEALIIGVSVVGGIIVLTITCCCVYCCCCRGGNKKKYDKEDARYSAQKMERKAKNEERRSERKERLDEIRRKYGLMKDEPCQRFDA